ncbi:MAG: hypothetical protein AAFY72_01855 [Cyanobacteria bacterium J06649_4]
MKLIQVVRPLFLIALALHGLALFVPLGAEDPAVIEDLELSELSDAELTSARRDLPVPDPNVSTGTTPSVPGGAKPGASSSAKPAVAGSPTAVANRSGARSAAVAVRPTATTPTRPASAQPRVAVSGGSSSGSSTTGAAGGASSGNNSSGSAGIPTVTPAVPVSPNRPATSPSASTSSLPVLGEDGEPIDNDSSSGNSGAGNGSGSGFNAEVTIAALLDDVTQTLPESLQASVSKLRAALTYDDANTDDDSAQALRTAWKANVESQADIATLDQLAPAALAALTQVSYPIDVLQPSEASKREADYVPVYLAGRSLNICLEQEPHKAEVGVVFDAQGNVVDEPTLIRSTGYAALNDAIRANVVASDDFPRDRSSKAYNFEVEVDYDADACVTLGELKD